jgi:hypothetical protein
VGEEDPGVVVLVFVDVFVVFVIVVVWHQVSLSFV